MTSQRRRHTQRCIRHLLQLQGGKCFYCQQPISEADASLDHLVPRSVGGGGISENNLVVCCRPINHFFGNVSLKVKFMILADSNFVRTLARWCLVVDRNRERVG